MKNSDSLKKRYYPQVNAFKRIAEKYIPIDKLQNTLIVGCGRGHEAVYLQDLLGVRVYGLDVDQQFDQTAADKVDLQNYDGITLPFPDNHFDVIYSFHVLEHAENPDILLKEMSRVLVKGGMVYIGVPNKSRIAGYFGMKDKTLFQKWRQNLLDWRDRLTGRFRNELGAHAGFTEKELTNMLGKHSTLVIPVTLHYYASKKPWVGRFVHLLSFTRLYRLLYPSVYVIAIKN